MIDWSKPIRTMNGHKARVVGMLANMETPYAVAITYPEFASGKKPGESLIKCTPDGKLSQQSKEQFIVNEEVIVKYQVIYYNVKGKCYFTSIHLYDKKEDANGFASKVSEGNVICGINEVSFVGK